MGIGSSIFMIRNAQSGTAIHSVTRIPEVLMNLKTSTRQAGTITVVDVQGRIVLGEESANLRGLISELLTKGDRNILLNLADVQYIDSSGLGSLVAAFTSVRKQEGQLKLLKLTNKVQDVLQITKLYTVFDIFDDEALAVKSYGQSTAVAS